MPREWSTHRVPPAPTRAHPRPPRRAAADLLVLSVGRPRLRLLRDAPTTRPRTATGAAVIRRLALAGCLATLLTVRGASAQEAEGQRYTPASRSPREAVKELAEAHFAPERAAGARAHALVRIGSRPVRAVLGRRPGVRVVPARRRVSNIRSDVGRESVGAIRWVALGPRRQLRDGGLDREPRRPAPLAGLWSM